MSPGPPTGAQLRSTSANRPMGNPTENQLRELREVQLGWAGKWWLSTSAVVGAVPKIPINAPFRESLVNLGQNECGLAGRGTLVANNRFRESCCANSRTATETDRLTAGAPHLAMARHSSDVHRYVHVLPLAPCARFLPSQ